MDRRRAIWQTLLLHAVLIGGSVIFALPYFWLVGTSWKLDKEAMSAEVSILPQRPIPRGVSPYVDDRQYPEMEQPADVGRHRWEHWMQAAVCEELRARVDDWLNVGPDDRVAMLDRVVLVQEMVEGLFQDLRLSVPPDSWRGDEESVFRGKLRTAVDESLLNRVFEQVCRCFCVGKILVKDRQYAIHDLTGDRPVHEVWKIESGPVVLHPREESERPVALLQYDFTRGDAFELSTVLKLPFEYDKGFKRLSLSLRRDQTWHELRVFIETGGRLLRSASPRYLGEDTWSELNVQEPSPDDDRLVARQYVLLEEVDRGPQYDHGPGTIKLRVRLSRSSTPEAFWAKGTENYRKAFDQVPFWRYFKTSVFLVIVNVLGTALSCSLVAFAFARLTWPGRELSFLLVLATLMIPPQVTMIPSFVVYKYLGWYNTLAPLWVPNCLAVNAFAVFLLRQAMKGIPRDLEDAAKIDGCGWTRIFFTVALPLMRPTLAAVSIFTFMFVWNDFMTPLIYVNDQRLYPLALGLFSFLAGRENQFTLIMAGSMIMTVPVILTFFFAQRHFIQGVTMTGMKN